MPGSPSSDRQRILLVTGMLGAGKTTALHELEDIGWEAVDNFPIRLLGRLIGREGERAESETAPLAIGFDSRTRGFSPDRVIERVKQLSARAELEVTTLFLDCSTAELQRRFDEARRRHHLAQDVPVDIGILAERELLAPLRRWADVLIDTTRFSSNELRQVIVDERILDPIEVAAVKLAKDIEHLLGVAKLVHQIDEDIHAIAYRCAHRSHDRDPRVDPASLVLRRSPTSRINSKWIELDRIKAGGHGLQCRSR